MDSIHDQLKENGIEAEAQLIDIASHADPELLLVAAISDLLFMTKEDSLTDKYGHHPSIIESLAKILLPLSKTGLMNFPLPEEANACASLAETIYLNKVFAIENESTEISHHLNSYSKIVRGDAFPDQTRLQIESLLTPFDNWLESTAGVSASTCLNIVQDLFDHVEKTYSEQLNRFVEYGYEFENKVLNKADYPSHFDSSKEFLSIFSNESEVSEQIRAYGFNQLKNEVLLPILPVHIEHLTSGAYSKKTAEAFKSLLVINKDTIAETSFLIKPIIEFSDGRVVLTDISNTYDALFNALEHKIKLNSKCYDRYQKKRAKWLESKAMGHLKRIFSDDAVYENLSYPDPQNENATAEIDGIVRWGPFLLLIEAKSKQFRKEGVLGNEGKLRSDIKSNVFDSFNQAKRAISYIESNEQCCFQEIETSRKVEFSSSEIHRIYPISVTMKHLASLATQLNRLKEFNLFNENHYPFAICEADLDLITRLETTPEEFLHYISRRIEVLSEEVEWFGDELDFFAAYLDTRLNMDNVSEPHDDIPNMINISGYSSMFDELMAYGAGEIDEPPLVRSSLPDLILPVLDQLRAWDDNSARWTIFALLSLSNKFLSEIGHTIHQFKVIGVPHDGLRRSTISERDTVVSIVASDSYSKQNMMKNISWRAVIEKYRHRAAKSVSFSVICRNTNSVFDGASYIEHPWEVDPKIESELEKEPDFVPSKIPKRNEPCFCGSGKKYKKCHMRKVEESMRNNPYLKICR